MIENITTELKKGLEYGEAPKGKQGKIYQISAEIEYVKNRIIIVNSVFRPL